MVIQLTPTHHHHHHHHHHDHLAELAEGGDEDRPSFSEWNLEMYKCNEEIILTTMDYWYVK